MAVNKVTSVETDTFLGEGETKSGSDELDTVAPLYITRNKQRSTIRKKLLQSRMRKKSQKGNDGNNNATSEEIQRPESPYTKANFLSQLTFWWLNPLMLNGYRKSISQDDIHKVHPSHGAQLLTESIEKIETPTLWRSLLKLLLLKLLATGFLAALAEAIKICQPLLVGRLILYFKDDPAVSQTEAIILAVVLALSGFIFSLPNSFYFYLSKCMAMQARATCSSLIYKKSLRVGNSALSVISAGKVVNLMSTDVEKFNNGIPFLHYLWIAPVELAVVMALLYQTVGLAFLPGLIYVVIMIPVQLGLGNVQGRLRFQVAGWTDRRVSIMGEILQGIRVIKMYCWQLPFQKLISEKRRKEVRRIVKAMLIKGQTESICTVSPKLVTMAILVMYYLTGNAINPDTVVKVIGWTELLKLGALLYLAQAAQYSTEMYASVTRIHEYLMAEEVKDTPVTPPSSDNVLMTSQSDVAVTLKDVRTTWETQLVRDLIEEEMAEMENPPTVPPETVFSFSLEEISLSVNKGDLIGIVGPIGSGKTSLLLSMLKEMPLSRGQLDIQGSMAYVPQEAWVQPSSIKDNILFGNPYVEVLYKKTVEAAALDSDIQGMALKDDTKVGERGFALSGGQKARVNLARSIYRNCDVYLLDDPLSAVDSKVAKHLFEECICGALKHKTRILVTHQVQFLRHPRVSRIYVMQEGKITNSGSFKEIANILNVEELVTVNEHKRRSFRRTSSARVSMLSMRHPSVSTGTPRISVSDTPRTPKTPKTPKNAVSGLQEISKTTNTSLSATPQTPNQTSSDSHFPFDEVCTSQSTETDMSANLSTNGDVQTELDTADSAKAKRQKYAKSRQTNLSSVSNHASPSNSFSSSFKAGSIRRIQRRAGHGLITRRLSAISNYTGESAALANGDDVFNDEFDSFRRQLSSRSARSMRKSRQRSQRRHVQAALMGVLTMVPKHADPDFIQDARTSIRQYKRQSSTFTRYVAFTPEADQDIDIYHHDHTTDGMVPERTVEPEMERDTVDGKTEGLPNETRGAVSSQVYTKYLRAGHGLSLGPVVLILTLAAQAAFNGADWCYSKWHEVDNPDEWMYLCIGLTGALLLLSIIRSWLFFIMTSFASRNLHDSMFDKVLGAPMSFFEKNPVGQVLNRFTRDMGFMDDFLPQTLHQSVIFITQALGVIVLTAVTNYWTIIAVLPMLGGVLALRHFALKALRDLKRIEAANRSPIYSHLSATLEGLHVIRAFRSEERFLSQFYSFQDNQTSAQFLYLSATRWLALRLDWVVSLYFSACILAAFLIPDSLMSGSLVGLSLSYISSLLGQFQYIVRQTADVETFMTSVERVLQYTHLEQEVQEKVPAAPSSLWPSQGCIEFQEVSLAYDKRKVLDEVNIRIKGRMKVGIVGRSGAGKSSLITCLFRLAQPEGAIMIDQADILRMGLNDVRSRISIIPQDPILFSGTLRFNLDPLNKYQDKDIWDVLEKVQLKGLFTGTAGLQEEVQDAGGAMSQGERQLLCVARAILTNNRIMIIDEATANVDKQTDEVIQKTLRDSYHEWTVLTIAHRLNTIIDCDKIIVMDEGKVAEFDSPYHLLCNKESIFSQMAAQDTDVNTLFKMADEAHRKRTLNSVDETNHEFDENKDSYVNFAFDGPHRSDIAEETDSIGDTQL